MEVEFKRQQRSKGRSRERGYSARDDQARMNPTINAGAGAQEVDKALNWLNSSGSQQRCQVVAAVAVPGEARVHPATWSSGTLVSHARRGALQIEVPFDPQHECVQLLIWFSDDADADAFEQSFKCF